MKYIKFFLIILFICQGLFPDGNITHKGKFGIYVNIGGGYNEITDFESYYTNKYQDFNGDPLNIKFATKYNIGFKYFLTKRLLLQLEYNQSIFSSSSTGVITTTTLVFGIPITTSFDIKEQMQVNIFSFPLYLSIYIPFSKLNFQMGFGPVLYFANLFYNIDVFGYPSYIDVNGFTVGYNLLTSMEYFINKNIGINFNFCLKAGIINELIDKNGIPLKLTQYLGIYQLLLSNLSGYNNFNLNIAAYSLSVGISYYFN